MKSLKFAAVGVALVIGGVAVAPTAMASQKTKNDWRNAAIGSGAVALYGLHNHDKTTTILGAAGAAYSANRYEQDRHNQSKAAAARARYHRAHRYYRRHHAR